MSDDPKKPDPIDDLKRGLGLLFRAAKTAVEQLPSDKLEKVVISGVKEVGRAIENVTDQLDRQVFGGKGTVTHDAPREPHQAAPAPAPAPKANAEAPAPSPDAVPPPEPPAAAHPDDAPKGPRVV